MKKRLLILGAGGHGKVAADTAVKMKEWESIAFLDDNKEVDSCLSFPVIGTIADAPFYVADSDFFVAVGNNAMRERLQGELEEQGGTMAVLVHPNAVVGLGVEIGEGSMLAAGAVVNSASRIGKGCIINTGAGVDHDNELGDYVHIAPGAHLAGTVKIGKGSFIGAGSTVSNNIRICGGCQTGAGAVVVRNIEQPGIYVGVPAQKLGDNR